MNTPADRPVLEELDAAECLELISPGGVGRVAFDDGEGPTVIPVNYTVEGTAVIFRTSLEGRLNQSLATVLTGAAVRVAFEVDRIDEERHEGWSVLLRGGGEHLPDHERPTGASVEPWPGGDRPAYIRIEPQEISGRRLGHR
ncbi:pyridoxamine 5'-phosphate oxidase family protein [Actinomadura sp. 21ATH]|uniref:pyridoxamine 5'-phosphate oxidase family protein n=1 Tax=Actinomadura sp. 21ATH TaxID=1735444 RepID=UPI0035C20A05